MSHMSHVLQLWKRPRKPTADLPGAALLVHTGAMQPRHRVWALAEELKVFTPGFPLSSVRRPHLMETGVLQVMGGAMGQFHGAPRGRQRPRVGQAGGWGRHGTWSRPWPGLRGILRTPWGARGLRTARLWLLPFPWRGHCCSRLPYQAASHTAD